MTLPLRSRPIGNGYRLVVPAVMLTVLLIALVAACQPLVRSLLPLYRATIDLIGYPFTVSDIRLARVGVDQAVVVTFKILAPVRLTNGRTIKPDPRGTADVSISAAKALQPVACVLAICLLWPWRDRRELAMRAAFCGIAVPVLLALDFPFVITGLLRDLVQSSEPLATNVVQMIGRAMEAGGRIGAGIVAGVLIVASARWFADGWAATARTAAPATVFR